MVCTLGSWRIILSQRVSKNYPIHVCKACADKRLKRPDDLIGGAEMRPVPVLVDMMGNPKDKLFTS